MLCYSVPCCTMLCYAMLWYAMLYYAMLCYAMLCCTMLYYAMLCYAVLCCTMLCYAMLYYAVLCYAMLCCTMLYYAMLCCDGARMLDSLHPRGEIRGPTEQDVSQTRFVCRTKQECAEFIFGLWQQGSPEALFSRRTASTPTYIYKQQHTMLCYAMLWYSML